jgi:hypothetical protein
MGKIKSYEDFQPINESLGFGNSEEYFELKKNFSKKETDELKEYFYELTDDNLMTLRIWSYIGESDNGRSIGYSQSSVDIGKNHSIFYTIQLTQKGESMDLNIDRTDNIRKVSDNLKKLADTIDSFKSSFSDDLIEDNLSRDGLGMNVKFVLRGESINKHTLETYYKKWKGNFGEKYDEGLNYLISEYQGEGIQDPPLDTNENGDTVLIGFFTEDEIIVVATYNKSKNEFKIDWPEFGRSIEEYRIENQ